MNKFFIPLSITFSGILKTIGLEEKPSFDKDL
jgi:hypothetical protein